MIEQVNTATLKQQLCHYLGLVRQGKEVLITSHKRIIARLLGRDEDESRLPLREPKESPASLKEVGGFVVSDGCLGFRVVSAHHIVAPYMDDSLVFQKPLLGILTNTPVSVENDDVLVPEVIGIVVGKAVVAAGNGVALDAIALKNRYLAAVIRYKKVRSALHYLVGGVVEKVLNIEFQRL